MVPFGAVTSCFNVISNCRRVIMFRKGLEMLLFPLLKSSLRFPFQLKPGACIYSENITLSNHLLSICLVLCCEHTNLMKAFGLPSLLQTVIFLSLRVQIRRKGELETLLSKSLESFLQAFSQYRHNEYRRRWFNLRKPSNYVLRCKTGWKQETTTTCYLDAILGILLLLDGEIVFYTGSDASA